MSGGYEERPVVIEVTTRHVVWLQGDSADEALTYAKQYPFYELIKDGETDVSTWCDYSLPDSRYDWDEVYEMSYCGAYQGRECNAHVEAYRFEQHRAKREAERAACTDAGHPKLEKPLSDGRAWCPGCCKYLIPQDQPGVHGGD